MKRLKHGEGRLEELFSAASGYVKYVAYHYLVDKTFVEDVVNSTFFRVFDNIQTFDETQSGKAWISKIAQNEAYTINNRERKHNHAPLDEISEEVACTTDDSQKLELVAAFEKSLSELNAQDREIFELRFYQDMTFAAIGKRLNMYVGTVQKKFVRSAKKIYNDIS
ncbi:MAG: sigma-70 family RNA polymerase sigma factor [Clostridiales bacterium]|nr:sigma-70 family RNA polymerase sigma factor [Clostridiales bacterium]